MISLLCYILSAVALANAYRLATVTSHRAAGKASKRK
jgi:hypothetical protein